MFGENAPVWEFLRRFGGPADPFKQHWATNVYETYPVAAMIALDWMLPDDDRHTGRLPKYNPQRKKTFSLDDWKHVCQKVITDFAQFGLPNLSSWVTEVSEKKSPGKADQDQLDSCICLLVALRLAEGAECLVVGHLDTGYMVFPSGKQFQEELTKRCAETGRPPKKWVRSIVRSL
jgi:predicted RNase H-like nuclease